jgi:hypothetical protein
MSEWKSVAMISQLLLKYSLCNIIIVTFFVGSASIALVSSVLISEKLFIGGDLNGHICSTRVDFDEVHGGFGYGSRNQEG